jgi:hypothetical protein
MSHELLDRLTGAECHFCEGSVAPGEYKGTAAAVCEACGTPTARLFCEVVPTDWERSVGP